MSKYSKQISLGYDAEGKRIRKRIYADSKQELQRKERELYLNADQELQSNITWKKYTQQWFEAYKAIKGSATKRLYTYTLNQLSSLDNKRLKDVTRTDVQKVINTFMDRPHAAHMIAMTAKQVLEAAAADGLITPKYLKFELPKKQSSERRPFTAKEKEAIKAADLTPQERLFVDIEYYLGLRPEETRALQPRDFDLNAKTVSITKASALYSLAEVKGTKTGRNRVLPVPDVLIAEIRAYNASFRGFYYFVDEKGVLFGQYQYERFTKSIFSKINKALGGTDKLSLLDGMTMYTFRHNRATELYYLNGVSTKKKAEYMGHSEMMFLKTYSHLVDENEELELLRKTAD